MSEGIKEILDNLKKTADNCVFMVCRSQEELDQMPRYTANFMSINDRQAKILLKYIKDLQQKVEQLENTLNIEKHDYNYLKTLFSKSSKKEVLKAYTYKCEQVEKIAEARNEFEMKSMQLENIRKEAIEILERHTRYSTEELLNILNKGNDKK